jgi:peptide/nickel transport system substrate-binding protein
MASVHTLARLLKRARLEAGLTQEELAARSGVSVHTISDLERGLARHTRASTLALLADVLSLGADELACIEDAARGRDTPSTPTPGGGSAPQDPATDHQVVARAVPPTENETPPGQSSSLTLVPDPEDSEVPPAAARLLVVLTSPLKSIAPLRKRIGHLSRMWAAVLMVLLVLLSSGVFGALGKSNTPFPVRGGTWIVDLQKDPQSLIPNGDGDAFDANELVDQALYLPLFYGDAQGGIHPGAARELPTLQNDGISADATIWTFHLRPGLVWSDGRPYDARDVDYTWRLWSNPAFKGDFPLTSENSPAPYRLIRSATVSLDHLSITFHLTQPYAPFLAAWVDGVQAPLPAHHFSTVAPGQVLKSADELHPTVTSGPFLLSESRIGDHYTLVRNSRYYLAGKGFPYLDKLVFRIGTDATIRSDFQAGAVESTQLARNNVQAYQQLHGYRLVAAPTSASFEALFFNWHNIVLATHPEVREAIARAIDQQALIQGPLHGWATFLCTDHPSALHPGYQPDAYCPVFGLDAANKVLDDAGWVRGGDGIRARNGQRLEFEYSTAADPDSWRSAVQRLVQQNLLAIGIKLDIENYPGNQFFQSILGAGEPSPPSGAVAGRFDIAEYAWIYGYDADDSVLLACDQVWPTGFNLGSYCNPALDALYQQELATPDPGLRQNLFDQIHQTYLSDLPFIVLFSPLIVTVVQNGTHNFTPSPIIGETSNVWAWWCTQGTC